MILQHKDLSDRWHQFSLYEQLANVGSEVERALKWKVKGDQEYSRMAAERAPGEGVIVRSYLGTVYVLYFRISSFWIIVSASSSRVELAGTILMIKT